MCLLFLTTAAKKTTAAPRPHKCVLNCFKYWRVLLGFTSQSQGPSGRMSSPASSQTPLRWPNWNYFYWLCLSSPLPLGNDDELWAADNGFCIHKPIEEEEKKMCWWWWWGGGGSSCWLCVCVCVCVYFVYTTNRSHRDTHIQWCCCCCILPRSLLCVCVLPHKQHTHIYTHTHTHTHTHTNRTHTHYFMTYDT